MRRILKLVLSCAALILVHEMPGQEIKFGEPQELDSSKFAERTVWIPYWTEKDGHHALLHLRNALHHYPLTASVEVLSQTGAVLASIPVDLPKASNLDLALQSYLPSGLDEVNRSGSIRITYSYQYDGALQAELSIRDSARKHAYTIVGRKAFAGTQNLAYLAVHRPTPQTYVELAFTNPLVDREVAIQIRLRRGSRWENLNRLSLKPLHTEKLRILADRLNDGEAGVSLLQAEYSVSTSEVIANAWLEDEATGFSNTALFHDHYPRSNTLYATQLIAGSLPDQVLDRGPRFDGSLVFVNFGQEPSTLEGTLHCMINGSAVPVPLPAMPLEPLSPRRIALSSLLAGTLNGAAGAMCSGQFTFTGPPGHVTGRYYAASESKVYGAYVKLEPFVGRAYSEVYWTTEEDFVPILTVTNFSRETDDIEIYISRRERFALLHSEPLAPGASLTVNVRDLLQRLRTEGKFTDEYGGTYIRTRKPSGKLMVKQHSISQRRLMMAPYYGGFDHVYMHWFSWAPPTQMVVGSASPAEVTTCDLYAGCYIGEFPIESNNETVVRVTNWPGNMSNLEALTSGNAELTSTACCDSNYMEVSASAQQVQVTVPPQFTVTTRAFIMQNHVGPDLYPFGCPLSGGVYYKGDDRSFAAWASSFRTQQQVVYRSDPGGWIVSHSPSVGPSRSYAQNAIDNNGRIGPEDEDGVPNDCSLWHAADQEGTNRMNSAKSAGNGVRVYGAAANPLNSLLDINWDYTVNFNVANPSQPTYSLTVTHDCFPAHEAYIGSQTVYTFTPAASSMSQIGTCLAGFGQIAAVRSGGVQ